MPEPVNSLTIFHDSGCGLCRNFRQWLESRALWLPVEFIPFDTREAKRRFHRIDEVGADREIVVLADDGQWWQGPDAWLVCLWATREHRLLSHRLATPLFRPWLRRIVHAISSNRVRISTLLGRRSERDLADRLPEPNCDEGNCRIPALRRTKESS